MSTITPGGFVALHRDPSPSPLVSPTRFNRASRIAATKAATLQGDLEAAYRHVLERLVRSASSKLLTRAYRLSNITAGAMPRWIIPEPEELFDIVVAGLALRQASEPMRVKIATAWVGTLNVELGISFDVTNPLLDGVFKQLGMNITNIAGAQRDQIMEIVQQGYDEGLGVGGTSNLLVEQGLIDARSRARTIARTEIVGAANGASNAGMNLLGLGWKSWLSTNDSRTRPDHADADGQTVPVSASFDVGSESLAYPGDPNGSADQVVACRCTVIAAGGPGGA